MNILLKKKVMKKNTHSRPSADATRASILNSALQLFARQGFAGTSISQIAKKAKINQSLIYHHFINKQQLWIEVKKHVMEKFKKKRGMILSDILNSEDPYYLIENLIRYRFDLYDSFPVLRRIIDWQFLEANPYELRGYDTETFEAFIRYIERLQAKGKIIKHYTADLLLLYIFHVPVGFFKGYKDMAEGFSGKLLKERKESYIQLCIETLTKALIIR